MENSCCSCLKPKATLLCGLCKEAVCKKCAQYLEEGCFSFLKEIPGELSHSVYCRHCYEDKIAPELDSYNEAMQRAKEIAVFYKDQSKETRLMSRKSAAILVADCADKEEAVLRLAFLAAKLNFNGIIDVDVSAKKIRDGAYQTQSWSGSAIPTNISAKKI